MTRGFLTHWLTVALLAVAYYGAGRLGQLLAIPPGNVTAVWFPSGIALAALLVLGVRVWPGIWVGAFFVTTWAFYDASSVTAAAAAVGAGAVAACGVTLQAFLGALLLRGPVAPRDLLERAGDTIRLVLLGGVLTCTVSPTVGVTSLCVVGACPWEDYGPTWLTWWLGDTVGVLLAAPLLLAWSGPPTRPWGPGRLAEFAGLLALLQVVGQVVFGGWAPAGMTNYPLEYLLVPCLLWAALRFGPRGTTVALLAAAGLALAGTVRGFGPFHLGKLNESLLLLQAFIGVVAPTMLTLTALVAERGRAEARRRQAELLRGCAYAVTRVLAESPSLPEAARRLLEAVCESLGWDEGAFWTADKPAGVLRCLETWHQPTAVLTEFETVSRRFAFAPGVGLPGRVWVSGRPAWIPDVTRDDNFPRAPAAVRAGLHAGFGFPVARGGEVLGVMEFFSRTVRPPDEDLLQLMAAVGAQVGQFLERKRAEEALRDSEARYRDLFENANDVIYTLDLDGRITSLNRRAEETFGYDRAECVGRGAAELIPPEHHAGMLDALRRKLGGEAEPTVYELEAIRKDGRRVPLEVSSRLIFRDGLPAGIQGIARDVTERRRAGEALRESEERFRTLADQAPVLIWVNSPTGCEYVNRPYLAFTGVTPEQVQGMNWSAYLHPEDRAGYVRGYQEAVERRDAFEAQFRFRRADGEYRWMKSVGVPRFTPAGDFLGYVGCSVDIHDLKRAEAALRESEERLRLALDAGQIGAWDWDILANRVTWSRRVYEFHGLVPGSFDGRAEDFAALVHPDDAGRVSAAIRRALDAREHYEIEFRAVRPDGEIRWLATSGRVFFDEGGRPARMLGATLDVTERHRAEEALREADRRKDEFLAMLAHELRNPLAPVRNAVHILKAAGNDGAATGPVLAMMERQVGHLVRMVEDLLDVSRVMRGKIELRPEPLELAAVVSRAVETARPLLDEQGHTLTVQLPPEPVHLNGDLVRLAQVVANLLNNAAKYTDAGGRVTLTARQEGGEAVLRVRDTGVGIDPALLPKVFDLFVQADQSLGRAQGGLGIGLTLVKRLVELHHGRVEAHSAGPGRGSEFIVRLPALPEPEEEMPRQADVNGRVSKRRVLVVDDLRDAADSLALLLRLDGHDVRVAHDGPAALRLVAAERPHVVFLDIGMPGMDGYEVARQLRRQPALQDVMLVALTGWGQEDDRQRTREAGFDQHLVKPADLAELRRLLTGEGPAGEDNSDKP